MVPTITDLSFQEYTDRQFREVEADRLLERAMTLRPSGNYRYAGVSGLSDGKGWVPQSYPGFAVVSMVTENPGNDALPEMLRTIQMELAEKCPWEQALYLLPPCSCHQTVANILSEGRFLQQIHRPGLEPVFPSMVAKVFAAIRTGPGGTLPMRLIGISIFGTALGLLGVFGEESDYQRITAFRSAFYSDEQLAALDVRMTRPFIGHITLAYIEADLSKEKREQLAWAVDNINRSLRSATPEFNLSLTGLRRYHHLSAFLREEDYPRYHF
jgi:hypothetical protein